MLFKNIWSCRMFSRAGRRDVWGPFSNHTGNFIQETAVFDFLLYLLLRPMWRSCYIRKEYTGSHKVHVFIYLFFIHAVSRKLPTAVAPGSRGERMAANQGLQISLSSGWKCSRISRWTSQRQRHL